MQPIPWYQAWSGILRFPSVTNFEVLIQNPNATRRPAYRWMAIIGGLLSIFAAITSILFFQKLTGSPIQVELVVSGMILICFTPIMALTAVNLLSFVVKFQNAVAQSLGGTGTYDQLIYAEATFAAPLLLASTILSTLPYLYLLIIPLAIYACILSVRAIKAVHQIEWSKAVLASLGMFMIIVLGSILLLLLLSSRGLTLLS